MEAFTERDRGWQDEGLTFLPLKKIKSDLQILKSKKINYLTLVHTSIACVPLLVTCMGTSVLPFMWPITLANTLIGLAQHGRRSLMTSYKKRVMWFFAYLVGPFLLGQPKSYRAIGNTVTLALYHFSIGTAYAKEGLDPISWISTSFGLLSSIFLVLDWMRWWQDYPLPVINAIAFSHLITTLYTCL